MVFHPFDLRFCMVSHGFHVAFEAFRWPRNSNEVGERGAEELAEALRVNRRLESLDLGNNQSIGGRDRA